MGLPQNPRISTFPRFLALFFILTLFLLPISSSSSSIYDKLSIYGLPMGLLPKGIVDFTMNDTTGRFQINLPEPCVAKFENQVQYDFNVSGTLTFGRIGELSGVLSQELFLWFPVKDIHVDVPNSGLIHFDVGVIDKQFSLSLFESPPDCSAADPSVNMNFARNRISRIKPEGVRNEVRQREVLAVTS